jgi:hypothetical protein
VVIFKFASPKNNQSAKINIYDIDFFFKQKQLVCYKKQKQLLCFALPMHRVLQFFIQCFEIGEWVDMKIICIKAPKFMSGFLKVVFRKYYITYE